MTTRGDGRIPAPRPQRITKRDVGPDAHRAGMAKRREVFRSLYDFGVGHGLEVGPLDSSVSDPDADDVRYVDVYDTAGVRAHYADDPNVLPELVPHIDYPIYVDGSARTIAEAAAPGAPYDWVIASHVIEHVPDMVGWLQQLAEITVDGAALLLAVPDRRYSFDRHRPPTTVGEALVAFEEGQTRPSLRAVYDHFSSVVAVDTPGLWREERPPGRDARVHDAGYLEHQLTRARDGEYVDCHVWTFTPESFLEQVKELRALGVCQWYVEKIEPRPGTVEFHALLRRIDRDGAGAPLAEPDLAADMPDWLADEWARVDEIHRLRARVRDLRQRVRALRGKLETLRERDRRLRERVTALEGSPAVRAQRRLGRVAARLHLRRE